MSEWRGFEAWTPTWDLAILSVFVLVVVGLAMWRKR